jgi:hypothetical protein
MFKILLSRISDLMSNSSKEPNSDKEKRGIVAYREK